MIVLFLLLFFSPLIMAVLVMGPSRKELEKTRLILDALDSTRPFVVSEYLERMEKANCEILRDKEAKRDTEPITLWIGLHGVRLVDGEVVWVDKYPKPKTQGHITYPVYAPVQSQMCALQYPLVYATQQAMQHQIAMDTLANQQMLLTQSYGVTAAQMSEALQQACCTWNNKNL